MQPLRWYFHRLRSMSPAEISWRVRSGARGAVERVRIPMGFLPALPEEALFRGEPMTGFAATEAVPGGWAREGVGPPSELWTQRLRRRAGALLENRLTFFNLEDAFVGDPVDWHHDHGSGRPASRRLSRAIDYRDFAATGDAKMVWEPNRHHHLVVLGRAFRAFNDPAYAEAAIRQIDSWIDANPYGYGMNWRSPLELAIRLINWVWTLDLVRDCVDRPEGFDGRVRETVWRHLREITGKYSRESSANNHLIGEAAGVFVASAWMPDLPGACKWKEESREILAREILRQTFPDGCSRELAVGYHLFVLQFFLVAGFVAKRVGMDFPASYWERVEKMLEFAGALAEGGPLPMIGDCDDGYVLDLAGGGNDVHELLSMGGRLLGRRDIPAGSAACGEAAWWLLGADAENTPGALSSSTGGSRLLSRAFHDSGLYLLQCGTAGGEDRISVLFDCGELGYGAIAAHGHADALSFTLRVGGRDVLVDTGTFDYFSFPEWRSYFRTTAAHNTLEIDGEDQSEILGPFLWGRRARAVCTRFETTGEGGIVAGEHDGYAELSSPATHSRVIRMDARFGIVEIIDSIESRGPHDVRFFFHVAEDLEAVREGKSTVRLGAGSPREVVLEADPALEVALVSGGEDPILGWVSRGYHRKSASTTIVAGGRTSGNASFRFRLRIRAAGILNRQGEKGEI